MTNQSQEHTFEILAHIPGIEFDADCEEICPNVFSVGFRFADPRPSRNGLVSDSFSGFVIIGKRGGVKGAIYTTSPGRIDYKIRNRRDLYTAASMVSNYRHAYYV